MPFDEPGLASVERAVCDLLVDQEVAALATLASSGYPSASAMHIAADRLSVYVHTFVDHRKYREMCRDPRVSYTAWHLPPGGFSERRMLRSLQMKGWASLVTEEQDLARAVQVSRQQFPWLADTKMYDHVKVPDERAKRVFFRDRPGGGGVGRSPGASALAHGAQLHRRRPQRQPDAPVPWTGRAGAAADRNTHLGLVRYPARPEST